MPVKSLYLQREIDADSLPNLAGRKTFVGIDLAPVDTLETGVAILDRNKNVRFMEKVNDDDDLKSFLDSLGAPEDIVIGLDIPKSLSLPGKWRQQEVKMHPLRLSIDEREDTDRFAPRAWRFYDALTEDGYLVANFFTHHARVRYGLSIPYKTRTPQGCRALQALLREKLKLEGVPTNLAPSSVLDALIAAYLAWTLTKGKDKTDYRLFRDDKDRLYLDPLQVT